MVMVNELANEIVNEWAEPTLRKKKRKKETQWFLGSNIQLSPFSSVEILIFPYNIFYSYYRKAREGTH